MIIPSSYWHCSAPGNSSLQFNTSRICYYQSACWRPLCPFEHTTRGRARKFAELWALLAKQEDEEQMIQAVPTQSKQGMLPDECRAVDNNEPKGQNEIAATTSAVDDDRTTPVTEAASIVHQNGQGHAERWIKRRGGAGQQGVEQVELEVAGTRTRHLQSSRAQPEDSLSPRSQTGGCMAQAVRELSKRT